MHSFYPELRRSKTPYPNRSDNKPGKDTGKAPGFLGIFGCCGTKNDSATTLDAGEKQGESSPKKRVISNLNAIVSKISRLRSRGDDKHKAKKSLDTLGASSINLLGNVSISDSSMVRKKVHKRDVAIVRVEGTEVSTKSLYRSHPYSEIRSSPPRTRPVSYTALYHTPSPYPSYVPSYVPATTSRRLTHHQRRKQDYARASGIAAISAAAAVCCC